MLNKANKIHCTLPHPSFLILRILSSDDGDGHSDVAARGGGQSGAEVRGGGAAVVRDDDGDDDRRKAVAVVARGDDDGGGVAAVAADDGGYDGVHGVPNAGPDGCRRDFYPRDVVAAL